MASEIDNAIPEKPERIRDVVYGVVPYMRLQLSGWQWVFQFFFMAFLIYSMSFSSNGINQESLSFAAMMILLSVLFVSKASSAFRTRNKTLLASIKKKSHAQDTMDPSLVRLILEAACNLPRLYFKEYGTLLWEDLASRCAGYGMPVPATVAIRSHRSTLEALELNEAMLEPETIVISKAATQRHMLISTIVLFVTGLILLVFSAWLYAATIFAITCIGLIWIPAIRDRLPFLRPDGFAPIVGMGYIQDMKERLWTVDDSLLILTGKGDEHGPVHLHFIGPAGRLFLTFTSVQDSEFIKLWQRWNHPDPRPELAPQT